MPRLLRLPPPASENTARPGTPGDLDLVSTRRNVLRAGALAAITPASVALSGCSMDTPDPVPNPADTAAGSSPDTSDGRVAPRVLLVYYSRAGENYYYGGRTDLSTGNTEVAASMITELISCDVHRLHAADPYPDSYDATRERNVTEQDTDARPTLREAPPDASGYDVVLLGSPIWNVRPPMLMNTAVEAMNLAGKRVLPFVTYAVSGLGSTARVYEQALPGADLGEGLAIRGEEVSEAGPQLQQWLRQAGLLSA